MGRTVSRKAVSFRLSREAHDALRALATRLGLSQASVVEMAVRQLAETLDANRRKGEK